MTSFVFLCVASALFLALLERLGLVELSLKIVADSRAAVGIITDASLDDRAKETAVQRMSARMLGHFALMTGLLVLACLLPAVLIWAGVTLEWTDLASLEATALSLPFILLNVAAFAAVLYWKRATS